MKSSISVENAKQMINDKLSHFFGVTPQDATEEQYYKAVAMIVRDDLAAKNSEFRHVANGQDSKKIYYLCGMNKQRKDILLEERGKFSLDTAKLIIGGVILAGIMRTDVSPECRRL